MDRFATAAMSALISKSKFFDVQGKLGEKISEEELREFKEELTATAYEYTEWMMIAREKSKEWLKLIGS